MRQTYPFYAVNARNLLETRKQGLLPDGPVIVSMISGEFAHTVLYVKPDMPLERLDWSMLVNLEVWVWATPAQPLERVAALVIDIAEAMPRELVLRFEDEKGVVHDIDVGSAHHHNGNPEARIAPEHSFLWAPLNLAMSTLGMNLKNALNRARGAHQ